MIDSQRGQVSPEGWHGKLSVCYQSSGGRTYPEISEMVAPLKLYRPFYDRNCATSVLLHTAGGMVGGDRLSIAVRLMPNTQVFWTTPSAAKVYRSAGEWVQNDVRLTVEPGACLTWFPLETILYDGARYQQQVRIDRHPGALYCGWDLTRLGRTALGEGFDSGQWRSQISVFSQGIPVWIDAQASFASSGGLESEYGLAGFPVVATFYALGKEVSAATVRQIRELISSPSKQKFRFGVTRLPEGLVARYRGHSTSEGKRWFMEVWEILRREWGRDILSRPRIWPI
ncbi:urease accessory protein UreD [Roseofilum casamattae]|uniref:Urease accessory protein UreD n=1 Tax=Roseofilum casamattae BLCC-M143 TaxID=3022442 RepID=A0ABT7BWW2_9CYAN|nr:urease accessory protein UreD [Roseofilum casamattae]MDJ1182946.1 urease accessory protein UreD [Roseofilum casamattae BLCC-M143]